jgi:hypothetical protein
MVERTSTNRVDGDLTERPARQLRRLLTDDATLLGHGELAALERRLPGTTFSLWRGRDGQHDPGPA